jgi:hypothetical protein
MQNHFAVRHLTDGQIFKSPQDFLMFVFYFGALCYELYLCSNLDQTTKFLNSFYVCDIVFFSVFNINSLLLTKQNLKSVYD